MKVVQCSSKSPEVCCRLFYAVLRFAHDSGAEDQLEEFIPHFGFLTQSNGNSAGEEIPDILINHHWQYQYALMITSL